MNEPPPNEKSKQWPQYLAAGTAILLAVSAGLQFGWPSPAIPRLRNEDLDFPVSKEQASYLVMVTPLGYLIGCPMTAITLDKIGRKFSMLILAGPQILAWLLIAHSTVVYMLYMARVSSAISEGGTFTSVTVYICEISEPKIRGALGMSFSVAFVFGTFLITCYGSYMPLRTSAYVSILVPLLFVMTFSWMPQSPYYCIMKGYTEEVRKNLRRLRKMQNVEEELIKSNYNRSYRKKTVADVFDLW